MRLTSAMRLLSRAYLGFAVLFGVYACYLALRDRFAFPMQDDWRVLDDFYSMSRLEWLFSDQNGHRTSFTPVGAKPLQVIFRSIGHRVRTISGRLPFDHLAARSSCSPVF